MEVEHLVERALIAGPAGRIMVGTSRIIKGTAKKINDFWDS